MIINILTEMGCARLFRNFNIKSHIGRKIMTKSQRGCSCDEYRMCDEEIS